MATAVVRELRRGRTGSWRGISGAEDRRVFRVTMTLAASEDGSETAPDPRFFVESLYPLGIAAPWNQFLGAAHYQIVETHAPTIADVEVRYEAFSLDRPTQTGWVRSSRATSVQLHRLTDLDGKPIGQRLYIPIAEGQPAVGQFWGQIFEPEEGDETGFPIKKTIILQRTEVVEADGETVDIPGIATTFTKLIADDGANMEPIVRGYIKRVNAQQFLGGDVGHIWLDDFDMQPDTTVAFQLDPSPTGLPRIVRPIRRSAEELAIGFAPIPAWRVSLSFIAADLPFDPIVRTPVFRDDRGNEAVVMLVGKDGISRAAIETFEVRERRDFLELFSRLNRT